MARHLIKQTIFQELRTSSDYRVHLTRITNVSNDYGQKDNIILNTAISKVTINTSQGILEFPIEPHVVYLVPEQIGNETIYKLYVWNCVALEEIGTSTNNNDTWGAGTYIIATDIPQNIEMNDQSTLIFEGGKFLAGLSGNNTAIQAPPVRIFGDNINLSGSFVNKSAFPEWWGAVPSSINFHTLPLTHNSTDNSQYIQKAFDSCFGEIQFCCGNYYISNTLTLTKMKTIKMEGLGLRTDTSLPNDFTTVLWTDKNIDVLVINIDSYSAKNGRLLIEGGEINVSKCSGDSVNRNEGDPPCYTSNAIKFYPTGEWGGKISMSLVGPIPYVGRTNGAIDWSGTNCHCPTDDEVNHNYKGTGVRFTSNEQSSLDYPTAYVFTLDCFILGFGQGIAINYSADDADMTSLHVYGVIDQCFIYLNAPSRGFNGGVFEPTIQARNFNTPDGYNKALIIGNFLNAYINPYIWDTSVDVDFFDFDVNTKNVSFGSRVISAINNQYQRMGMSTRDLAAAISGNQSRLLGSMGNFDLQQLSCVNASVQSDNYTHFIDNDLLGIDKIFNVQCDVQHNGFFNDSVQWSSSLFSREGMSFSFGDTADNPNAKLTITCNLTQTYTGYPANATRLQLLAIHLKGTAYNYFEEMQLSVNGEEYFNGSYIDIPLWNGLNDIIIPFLRRRNFDTNSSTYMKDNFFLGEIILTFSKLKIITRESGNPLLWGNVWGNERFKVAIEGRLNRHFKNNVWSAAGGDLGNHIMLRGKPYIIGNGNYTSLSDLPSNASIGAIAVVNGMYPVIKTTQGWMIQNLSGTSSSLQALNLSIGPMTLGQMAIATNLNKIVWWDNNNNYWRDAMGNPV